MHLLKRSVFQVWTNSCRLTLIQYFLTIKCENKNGKQIILLNSGIKALI
jgi:hypothetical protein